MILVIFAWINDNYCGKQIIQSVNNYRRKKNDNIFEQHCRRNDRTRRENSIKKPFDKIDDVDTWHSHISYIEWLLNKSVNCKTISIIYNGDAC